MRMSEGLPWGRVSAVPALTLFLLLYRVVFSLILEPLGRFIWTRALLASPVSFITNYNFAHVFRSPLLLAALAALLLGFALWQLLGMFVAVLWLDCVRDGKDLRPSALLGRSLFQLKRVFLPENLLLLPFGAVMASFTDVFMVLNLLSQITAPEYMLEALFRKPSWLFAGGAVLLVLFVRTVEWMFAVHFFVLEACSLPGAVRRSRRLIRGHRLRNIVYVTWNRILYWVRITFGMFLGAFLVYGLIYLYKGQNADFVTACQVILRHGAAPIYLMAAGCMVTYACYACLAVLYREGRKQDREEAACCSESHDLVIRPAARSLAARVFSALVMLGIVLVLVTEELVESGDLLEDFVVEPVQITGHRGYSSVAPENTLPAFQAAIDCGVADYAELDVRQTKDGVVVVSHDASLARCAGVSRYVKDISFAELRQLDASRAYRKADAMKYIGTRVPSLEEALKLCKGKLRLNIELKGSSDALVEETLRLIRENGFEEECVISSQEYEALEKVKERAPHLRCGYIMGLGVGFYYDLPAADFFSIESTFITPTIITELHGRGKEVHAWGVKGEKTTRRMLNLGVDNIITGEPEKVYAVIREERGEILAVDD